MPSSDSGVVNLYGVEQRSSAAPSPLKSFANLTTPVDMLVFNHNGELLVAASRRKKDALKLVTWLFNSFSHASVQSARLEDLLTHCVDLCYTCVASC